MAKSKVLTAEDILNADDIQLERVPVPEWGGDVFVKATNGKEFSGLQAQIIERKGNNQRVNLENIQAKLVAICVCDESGKRLFNQKQVDLLAGKSSAALQRVFKVAQRLSGLGDDEIEGLTDDLKENPTEDSPSD
jgi:hypothetical protein